jgi:translation initiation factor 3 subunit A
MQERRAEEALARRKAEKAQAAVQPPSRPVEPVAAAPDTWRRSSAIRADSTPPARTESPAPASGGRYRPPVARDGAAGGGWRAREAAKAAGGGGLTPPRSASPAVEQVAVKQTAPTPGPAQDGDGFTTVQKPKWGASKLRRG